MIDIALADRAEVYVMRALKDGPKYSGQDGLTWWNFCFSFENWANLPGLHLCRAEFQKDQLWKGVEFMGLEHPPG